MPCVCAAVSRGVFFSFFFFPLFFLFQGQREAVRLPSRLGERGPPTLAPGQRGAALKVSPAEDEGLFSPPLSSPLLYPPERGRLPLSAGAERGSAAGAPARPPERGPAAAAAAVPGGRGCALCLPPPPAARPSSGQKGRRRRASGGRVSIEINKQAVIKTGTWRPQPQLQLHLTKRRSAPAAAAAGGDTDPGNGSRAPPRPRHGGGCAPAPAPARRERSGAESGGVGGRQRGRAGAASPAPGRGVGRGVEAKPGGAGPPLAGHRARAAGGLPRDGPSAAAAATGPGGGESGPPGEDGAQLRRRDGWETCGRLRARRQKGRSGSRAALAPSPCDTGAEPRPPRSVPRGRRGHSGQLL